MPFIQLTVSSTKLPTEADPCCFTTSSPWTINDATQTELHGIFLSRRSPVSRRLETRGRGGQDRSVDPGPGRPGTANSRLEPGSGLDPFSFFFFLISPAVREGRTNQSHLVPDSPVRITSCSCRGGLDQIEIQGKKRDLRIQISMGKLNNGVSPTKPPDRLLTAPQY